jgi:hypothetical protein
MTTNTSLTPNELITLLIRTDISKRVVLVEEWTNVNNPGLYNAIQLLSDKDKLAYTGILIRQGFIWLPKEPLNTVKPIGLGSKEEINERLSTARYIAYYTFLRQDLYRMIRSSRR